jgi:hypothetical protein
MSEIKLNVVREKVCKNSIRVQAMGEDTPFRPESPSQFYIKNEIMQALGNPAEFEIILRAK